MAWHMGVASCLKRQRQLLLWLLLALVAVAACAPACPLGMANGRIADAAIVLNTTATASGSARLNAE
jgi:hypothetical protein